MAFETGPTKSSTDGGYAAAGTTRPPTLWQIFKNATVPTLAGYEVSLGVIGIISSIYALAATVLSSLFSSTNVPLDMSSDFLSTIGLSTTGVSTAGLAVVFYALVIVAGLLLSNRKQSGKNLSIIVHAIQIPVFAIGGIRYLVSLSGTSWLLLAGYKAHELSVGFFFSSGASEFFNKLRSHEEFFSFPSGLSVVGINILAIILLILFAKIQIR